MKRRITVMASEKIEVNGVEIDSQKAQRMLQRIIVREKTNIKTKQFNDTEMARKIKKMIEEEVQCY
jgi:hypothetical protein